MVHVYISMWLCVYKYICILCIHIIESRDVHIVYQGAAKNFQESHLWCCRRRTGWPRQLPQLRWLDLSMFLGLKTTEDLGENSGFWREGKNISSSFIFKLSIFWFFIFGCGTLCPLVLQAFLGYDPIISVITTCHLFCHLKIRFQPR